MIMKRQLLLPYVLIIMFAALPGCSKTIMFTQEIRQKVQGDGIDIREVQFYNDKKFTLQRNLSYEETKVAQGKIKFENGQFIEMIIIKKNTPGVCESTMPNSLDISFEQGENRKLRFVLNNKSTYQLSAIEWKDKFGKVSYDTLTYYITPGGDKTRLKVKKEYIFKVDKKQRVAPGRTVSPAAKPEKEE